LASYLLLSIIRSKQRKSSYLCQRWLNLESMLADKLSTN
jgi:hypothetical protein